MTHLLIVDDDAAICWGLSKLAQELGHTAAVASSAEAGLQSAADRRPDAIVLDVRLPGMDGLAALDEFRKLLGDVPVIMVTAYGDLATAVRAMRGGAFDYLVKPFDLGVARRAIQRALVHPPVTRAGELPAASGREIIGSSPAIQEVFKRIAVVAPAEACVHLRGESGTGKELVARAIHRYSRRGDGPFVAVNVASLSPALAESELFGHVRGAFTGAEQSRKGLLEQADGGTIFFDEVADIPPAAQVKLLRVLEYGEVLPVGGAQPIRSDFRVLSATHQNLAQKVASGGFRADLYYRLNTIEIELPPLRDRPGDVAELADYFLTTLAARNGCSRPDLPPEVLGELQRRPWHGNVRELRNALEHAVILARGGPLAADHLPPPVLPPADSVSVEEQIAAAVRRWADDQLSLAPEAADLYDRLVRLVERPLVQAALARCNGQYATAARRLGLHRVTLKRKSEECPPQ